MVYNFPQSLIKIQSNRGTATSLYSLDYTDSTYCDYGVRLLDQ